MENRSRQWYIMPIVYYMVLYYMVLYEFIGGEDNGYGYYSHL